MSLYVGTSGWQYNDWSGRLYPDDVPKARWLEYFADRFRTVEVNNTFYRLPKKATFREWADRTPDDFVIAPKMSRYLTHVKRLRGPAEPTQRFFGRAAGLGDKLGPVLFQLPPTLKADVGRLAAVLDRVPDGVRVAVEFRHDSWFTDEVADLLEEHDAALCLADPGSRVVGPVRRTASWGYLRMHAGRASPRPCYGRAALSHWAERLADLWGPRSDTYVFFNNDTRGCAVRDAARFARTAERAGLKPSRVPEGTPCTRTIAIRRSPQRWKCCRSRTDATPSP